MKSMMMKSMMMKSMMMKNMMTKNMTTSRIKQAKRILSLLMSLTVVGAIVTPADSWARAGGGRSFGGRGSRGFSAPARPYRSAQPNNPNAYNARPNAAPQSQPFGGNPSFLRSMGAGLAGGFLGSMLFRGLGGGGMGYGGMGGGGGIGLLDILLIGALAYFALRLFRSRRQHHHQLSTEPQNTTTPFRRDLRSSSGDEPFWRGSVNNIEQGPVSSGATALRLAPSTDLDRDTALDAFFRVQAAFSQRDLQPVGDLLEPEVRQYFESELAQLRQARRLNRLENIAVRESEVTESWEEGDQQFATVWLQANLLDYTVDETTQQVVDGSRSSPVKFEEYWTFTKRRGSGQWRLAAIQQA